MAWTCPKCGKTFAKANQSHICVKVEPLDLFENKAAHLPDLYREILAAISEYCEFRPTASTKSITLYGKAHRSFLVMQPKKKWIDLMIPLNREVNEFPVFRVHARSESNVMHFVRIEDEEDLQRFVFDLVAEAYQLTNP